MLYACCFHVCVCVLALQQLPALQLAARMPPFADACFRMLTYAQIRMLTRSRCSSCWPCPSYTVAGKDKSSTLSRYPSPPQFGHCRHVTQNIYWCTAKYVLY